MASNYQPIKVWSGLTRVLHWIIAIGIIAAFPLGKMVEELSEMAIPKKLLDEILFAHAGLGVIIGIALVIRIIQMFASGSNSSANWRDLIPKTKAQIELLKETLKYYFHGLRGKTPAYYAHNPLAGLAYAALYSFVLFQCSTGMTAFIIKRYYAGAPELKSIRRLLQNLHEAGAACIIIFIGLHVAALIAHEIVERRGLVSSMFGGYKFFADKELVEMEKKGALKDKLDE